MNRTHREKIDILIEFLKREPKEEDMVPEIKECLLFETKDSYKKIHMLDKHIKLVEKCINEGIVTFDYFFNSFKRITVLNYGEHGYYYLSRLFPNIYDINFDKVGSRFIKKLNVINVNGIKFTIEEPRDRSKFDLGCN